MWAPRGPSLSGASGRENPTGFRLPQSAFPCVTAGFCSQFVNCPSPMCMRSQPPPALCRSVPRELSSRMCMRSPLCPSCTNGGTRTRRAPARILVRLAPAARMRRSHGPPRSLLLVALPPRASHAPRRMPVRAARACDCCDSTRGPTLLATPSIYFNIPLSSRHAPQKGGISARSRFRGDSSDDYISKS